MDREATGSRAEEITGAEETKVCGTCKECKPLAAFNKNRTSRDGKQSRCKTCNKEYCAARRASFELERRARRRLIVIVMLGGRCVECGVADPTLLQFDHIDPETKVTNVCRLLHTCTWERIIEEAVKCQLLCVDCHRRKTRRETRARTLARWVEDDKAAGRFEELFPEVPRDALSTYRTHRTRLGGS